MAPSPHPRLRRLPALLTVALLALTGMAIAAPSAAAAEGCTNVDPTPTCSQLQECLDDGTCPKSCEENYWGQTECTCIGAPNLCGQSCDGLHYASTCVYTCWGGEAGVGVGVDRSGTTTDVEVCTEPLPTPLVALCPPGEYGAIVAGVAVCSQPLPCPSGYTGQVVEGVPACFRECPGAPTGVDWAGALYCVTTGNCPSGQSGIVVNGIPACVANGPCPSGESGIVVNGVPACVANGSCPSGYSGAVVEGTQACARECPGSPTGVDVAGDLSCATPQACGPGQTGQKVEYQVNGGSPGTVNGCVATPVLCTLPDVGVTPSCTGATTQSCPAGQVGTKVVYHVAGGPDATINGCTASPDPKTRDNGDGTCTAYLDNDHDSIVDAGETLATAPCPDAKVKDNGDGTYTVYQDKDHDDTVDSGETIVTTGVQDTDGDLIPDAAEPALCSNENPNIQSEGHCTGNDYTPPTPNDVIADVLWLLGM